MNDSIRAVYEYDIKELEEKLAPLRGAGTQSFMDERDCMLKTQNELRAELDKLRSITEEE